MKSKLRAFVSAFAMFFLFFIGSGILFTGLGLGAFVFIS